MNSVFGKEYSSVYDTLYEEKDYDRECDLVEQIFKNNSPFPVRTVLDLGCGTGNHALRLAARGYEVTGVDRSNEMLKIARDKAQAQDIKVILHNADLRSFTDGKQYDAVIMMFAVLGYQLENADIIDALKTVRRHLREGGIFIADVWFGPAVLHQRPGDRVRIIQKGNTKIIRISSGDLDTNRQIVNVRFNLFTIIGDRVVTQTDEVHAMRFFFPKELEMIFECCGLHIQRIGNFSSFNENPNESSWNVIIVADTA